ncbi:MAG: hypothetical protein V3R83_09155 [Gammaproteobacteria bacterium]
MYTIQRCNYLFVSGLFVFLLVFAFSGNLALAQPKPLKIKGEFYKVKVKHRGGTYVTLAFFSHHPVVPAVHASQKRLTIKKGGKEFANPQSEIESSTFNLLSQETKIHLVTLKDLKPDTQYFVGIIGHRKQGVVWLPIINKKTHTLKRRLDITFTKIEMIDDSDDLSDGEFKFGFFAYDGTTSSPTSPLLDIQYPAIWLEKQGLESLLGPPLHFQLTIGTGENKNIQFALGKIIFNKDKLKLTATGMDDDDGYTCGKGLVAPNQSAGDTECSEWGTGLKTINFQNKTNMSDTNLTSPPYSLGSILSAQEEYRIPFVLHANPSKVDLEFKVKGHVDVSYCLKTC